MMATSSTAAAAAADDRKSSSGGSDGSDRAEGASLDLCVVQLLFPMGGLGTRFANAGITTPKPLIEVDGTPMILKAIGSFRRLAGQVRIVPIFIVRREHEAEHRLASRLHQAVPGAKISFLDRDTAGAVETCMTASDFIDDRWPLVVMDCDLCFQSAAYEQRLTNMTADGLAGLLLYFHSINNRYSYARLASDGATVVETAEKRPISNCALIGAYGFGTGAIFKAAGRQLLEQTLNAEAGFKEYYVSLLYNFILKDGANRVVAVPTDEYHSFGTPEELDAYLAGTQSYLTE